MDYNRKDFENYAIRHLGIGSNIIHDTLNYQISSSMTPYILEERELRATSIDIFSRLMMDRILVLGGVVDDRMSSIVQAQLMYLDSVNDKDITLHIDSPGGSVKSGLSIIDVMDYINCDVVTINMGVCASMGAVLLAAGKKSKRSSLRFSKTMLHSSSGGVRGVIHDAKISWEEWQKTNDILFELLGSYTNKTAEQVFKDSERDKWFTAGEALEYGLIDEIITTKKKQ